MKEHGKSSLWRLQELTAHENQKEEEPHDGVPGTVPCPKKHQYRPATECVLVESTASSRDPYQASSMPVYLTATFKQDSALGGGDYDYSRSGNPTRTHVGMNYGQPSFSKKIPQQERHRVFLTPP
jgi:hypothetical protein